MNTIKIITIVGARPQFVKAAAVSRAISEFNRTRSGLTLQEGIVHTGQHYDDNMSKVFFDELHIPRPIVNLEVGSGSHGRQTGAILERLEDVLLRDRPDWLVIYGDTNSTLSGALAAAKLHIPVAHIEAGLRSFNRTMPEEINRVVADAVSTLLLCPTETAVENLRREGHTQGVHLVGDVMYDSIQFNVRLAEQTSDVLSRLGLSSKSYYLSTIHRAENSDDPQRLEGIMRAFSKIDMPIVLPLHPRMRNTLGAGLKSLPHQVRLIDPVPYLDMLMLEKHARIILTDSGGVQKESYWLDTPCVTLRDETEWVELVHCGCNRLTGADPQTILQAVRDFEASGASLPADRPTNLYGEGHAATKIIEHLVAHTGTSTAS